MCFPLCNLLVVVLHSFFLSVNIVMTTFMHEYLTSLICALEYYLTLLSLFKFYIIKDLIISFLIYCIYKGIKGIVQCLFN